MSLRLSGCERVVDLDLIETAVEGVAELVADDVAGRAEPAAIAKITQPARQAETAAVLRAGERNADQLDIAQACGQIPHLGVIRQIYRKLIAMGQSVDGQKLDIGGGLEPGFGYNRHSSASPNYSCVTPAGFVCRPCI